ncbi:hypothetical protein HYPSUDRAFT_905346 [Hypholoma sublateritium FD-334 SS-4]|uniref:Uncharacterized protein n=1 Tax=Hypholoma sublateritium (strain FD-334 SS-4) TaxID=945553 RepID=A0A0D2KX05_HYPSF|nr:hypothetical protein HYPSUDRAFT_905346 [Hypholoma sublateritium FD-334 SS-4]
MTHPTVYWSIILPCHAFFPSRTSSGRLLPRLFLLSCPPAGLLLDVFRRASTLDKNQLSHIECIVIYLHRERWPRHR